MIDSASQDGGRIACYQSAAPKLSPSPAGSFHIRRIFKTFGKGVEAACATFIDPIAIGVSRAFMAFSAVNIEACREEQTRSRLGQQNTAKGQGESC